MEIAVEPAFKPGVGGYELVHQPVVARNDHDQVVPVVFHRLQERVHRFLTEVVAFLVVGERVSLVYEQYAAQGFVDHVHGLARGLPHITGHQAAPVDFHQLAFGKDAEALVYPRHDPGDHCLARAGVAAEHHVQGHIHRGQVVGLAHLVHPHHVYQVVHLCLYAVQTYIGMELVKYILQFLGRFFLSLGLFLCLGRGFGALGGSHLFGIQGRILIPKLVAENFHLIF